LNLIPKNATNDPKQEAITNGERIMLSQFELGQIEAAFQLAEVSALTEEAKAKIAYCRKLIKLADERETIKHANHHASAIGRGRFTDATEATRFMDRIAADCSLHGSD
jgi:hypothetical protein